ncbi:AsmA family protein [Janthinobacterium agaricidamnosum]|uniref:AsmA family protein n=1 Tax=Janthinobacterium agaricidamnosum NBRC 102515 = DSM 9628 TaxID=1349767 RepID=W0VAH8_9BURK|nr:AsmA family protein [Janthinobacterium agaricidamnosum]CDG84363.1 asmA family protein [Janthinobacterium agaricidamnosum NBRC 102515 = DSM 9628]
MTMPRRTKIGLAIASFVITVPVAAVVVLLNVDWNRAKPWLNERTSEAIGRPFAIHGDLSLTWDKGANAGQEKTWRDYLPWPHLVAKDVHVGNPAAMTAADKTLPADMASVSQFSFSLNPLALLDKKIAIPELRFNSPQVFLQRNADGNNNWTFDKKDKPSPWQLDLQSVVFTKGTIHLIDARQHANIRADVDTIAADPTYGVSWTVRGKYNGDTVSGSGKAGAVLSLQQQIAPYPVAADLKVGGTAIAIVGTLTRPTELAALDMRLKVSGASMARLYPLTGIVLPETPHFATEGHLTGTLGAQGSRWRYDAFSGKVGSSDIGGQLAFQQKQPRNLLTGAVKSRLLQFSDLGPLVGADSNASKTERGVPAVQPADKVLPVETFKTERWTSIDADVSYQAAKIIRDKDLPISNLNTHFILKDGVLSLLPLNFDIAGGKLTSEIKLDGSGKTNPHAIRAELTASARHLKLQQLFPTLDALHTSVGQINGDAKLSATGNSVASLLGSSNGEVKTLIDQGTISKLLLEEMGLNIGNVVLTKLVGDKQVKLNCMATDFAVSNGLMQTRSFIVDTEEALLNVDGTVNLANEKLDLTLKPDTKSLRVFSLRSPLYVRGTFSKPDVSVDKGVLALRAGGALALAAVAPVAALIPLINTGPGHDSACGKLLAEARVKPVAPPPGKTLHVKPNK